MAAAVRNKNLKDSGWTEITGSYLQEGEYITSLAVSRKPSDRLYFGTVNGRIFRIDNASGNNPIMINITPPEFPKAYLACIDIDPDDADKVVAVFSNYNVKSIFYSSLGGANWENIGGNLEENPDGSGAGPSVRCFRTARFEGKTVYFAGTSTGLYSATEIRGSQTQWFREGANSFGVILVDNIESRELDGLVAIATQGYGVFSTKLDFSGAGENAISSENAYLDQNHPNPAKNSTTFSFTNPSAGNVKLSIYDILGEEIDVVANKEMLPGKYRFIYNTEKINRGSYFYRLETGKGIFTRKMLLE
jgi:hypothetical protein